MRHWKLGEAAWCWPDNVDETGTDTVGASRYLPVIQARDDGYSWTVAKVFVDEDDPEMADDARLIATAPELLAALRAVNAELIELYERAYPDDETDNDTTAAIDMAIAAIAKAEGE